jgi:hypothetical protein
MHPLARALALCLLTACESSRPTPLDAAVTDTPVLPDAPAVPDVPAVTDTPVLPDAGASCAEYALTDEGGSLMNPAINETSGVVTSRRHPGVLYVHNDSGDSPRFFAVNLAGQSLAEYRLDGARAVDWEDVAQIPCGATRCIVFGDIGDNDRVRPEVTLYRVEEPEVPMSPPATVMPATVPFTALTFRYPDGAHNAETLVGDPATGEIYVITKVDAGRVTVYRAPRENNGVAERVTDMDLPAGAGQLTGGDVRGDGREMLLRTYARVLRYERPEGAPFTALFAATPTTAAVRLEPQGESVGYTAGDDGYLTISEGARVRINVFRCASP